METERQCTFTKCPPAATLFAPEDIIQSACTVLSLRTLQSDEEEQTNILGKNKF